jgi:hypothetical protein
MYPGKAKVNLLSLFCSVNCAKVAKMAKYKAELGDKK